MNITLLNTHEIFPSHLAGGIEKRIEALVKHCRSNKINLKIISQKPLKDIENYILIPFENLKEFAEHSINFLDTSKHIISYNLHEEALKVLDQNNIKVINANCGGMAKGSKPEKQIYSSKNIKNRFLSLNQKISYNGFYKEEETCVIPHGLGEEEFYFNKEDQTKEYFLWCASLGWGLQPKGLDIFIKLAQLYPNENFVAYGSTWNSENLENFIKNLNIKNLSFNLGLNDKDKNKVFSKAIALCQFTRLIESCNIVTLESFSRGAPVITLDEDQGGVTNNAKFFDLTLKSLEDLPALKQKAIEIDREEVFNFYKNRYHCRNELDQIMEEFNK